MKFKKLASLLIAGAMVFSMAMPAFASGFGNNTQTSGTETQTSGTETETTEASPSDLSRSLKFEGMTKVPTVKVTMPATSQIILNPFGLKVGTDESTDEFISTTVRLVNESDCKIAVSGTITPAITGNAALVDTPAKADTGTPTKLAANNVFVAMAITEVESADAELEFDSSVTGDTYRDKMKSAGTTAAKYMGNGKSGADAGFYVLKTAATAVNFGDSSDSTKSGNAKLPYVLDAGDSTVTYLAFKLYGLCETKVATPWAATDTVSVTMALTLVPYAN